MDVIVGAVKWQFLVVYLGDIVMYSKSQGTYIGHVSRDLKVLNNADIPRDNTEVTLKLKCAYSSNRRLIILVKSYDQRCWEIASHTTDAIDGPNLPSS